MTTHIDKVLVKFQVKFWKLLCKVNSSLPSLTNVLFQKENVTVMSIGIGRKVKYKELQKIATNEDHVFFIKDFKYLVDKINALVELSCEKEIPRATGKSSIRNVLQG